MQATVCYSSHMQSKTFLEETYELVANCGLTQRQIAEGAGVNYWWYIKFAQRSIPDPGVERVQKVHDFLKNRAAA